MLKLTNENIFFWLKIFLKNYQNKYGSLYSIRSIFSPFELSSKQKFHRNKRY